MHRITLDHVDRDIHNSSKANLRVYCFDCNRARVGQRITKDLSSAVIKAIFDLIDEKGAFPSDVEVAAKIGITSSQLSGSRYSIRVMRKLYSERK